MYRLGVQRLTLTTNPFIPCQSLLSKEWGTLCSALLATKTQSDTVIKTIPSPQMSAPHRLTSQHSTSLPTDHPTSYAASLRIINFLLRKECQERARRNQERAAAAAAVAAAASGPMPMEEVEATGGIIPPPAINTGAATAAVAPPALAPLADEPEEILKSTGVTVTAMLHRLVDVALCAHDGGFADLGSEVVIDAIHTINSVMMQPSYVASAIASPTTLPPLLTSTSAERFVVSIIVDNPVENVSKTSPPPSPLPSHSL